MRGLSRVHLSARSSASGFFPRSGTEKSHRPGHGRRLHPEFRFRWSSEWLNDGNACLHSHPISFVSTGDCIDAKICTGSRGSFFDRDAGHRGGKYNKAVSVGDKAPDFSGPSGCREWLGHQPDAVGHQGRPVVVLVFLGNHCPVVQGVRRPFDRLHRRLQGQGREGRWRERQRSRQRPHSRRSKST